MRVCIYNGLTVVVLTGEQEHCPPHVHVEHDGWDARFKFSFLHGGVDLWTIEIAKKSPGTNLLEGLRKNIEMPTNLQKAREKWWEAHGVGKLKICLNNKYWDPDNDEEIDGKFFKKGLYQIQSAVFDPARNATLLTFVGGEESRRIDL